VRPLLGSLSVLLLSCSGLLFGQSRPLAYTAKPIAGQSGAASFGRESTAWLARPTMVVDDGEGGFLFTQSRRARIFRVNRDGVLSVFAGTGIPGNSGYGGPALARGADGTVVFASTDCRVRRIDRRGNLYLVAGSGSCSSRGETGVPANSVGLAFPEGVAIDGNGLVLIAETYGHRVRRVEANGTINSAAGISNTPATQVALDNPSAMRVDALGRLYVADNTRIYLMTSNHMARLEVQSGNGQSALVSTALPTPLAGKLTTPRGLPLAGYTVNFAVTTGQATVATVQVPTDANGLASTRVTFGTAAGPVVVTASVEGIISTRFELTATSPAPPPPPVNVNKPAIRSGGVTRAAAFGPSGTIAPGSWIEIYGSNFAPAAREWTGYAC
jgi:hypothetical protein